jgi:hypothetical protein
MKRDHSADLNAHRSAGDWVRDLLNNKTRRWADSLSVCCDVVNSTKYQMDTYESHPFANAFPMMNEQEHAALVADINANGLRELITRYDGKLLDGRNRDEACRELGIEPTYVEFDGDDAAALAFVISKNLVRRQLTASQRAMVADKLTTLKLGQRKSDTSKDVSQPEAAKLANASLPGTQRARTVRTKGTPKLVAAVLEGDVPVTAASEFAKQFSPVEQIEQIEKHGSPAGAVKAAKATTNDKHDPANKRGITALKAKLVEANRLRKESAAMNREMSKELRNTQIERNYLQERDVAHKNQNRRDWVLRHPAAEPTELGTNDPIKKKVGNFHHELTSFVESYCGHLQAWADDHPEMDDECKASLMQVLGLCSDRFQQLAQALDGR